MKMDYDECRAKISIIDIAEDLGYTRISGRQATNLTYVLGTPPKSRRRNSHLS